MERSASFQPCPNLLLEVEEKPHEPVEVAVRHLVVQEVSS